MNLRMLWIAALFNDLTMVASSQNSTPTPALSDNTNPTPAATSSVDQNSLTAASSANKTSTSKKATSVSSSLLPGAHTTGPGDSQAVSTTKPPSNQSTEVLMTTVATTVPVKLSTSKMANISPSTQSLRRTTSMSEIQPQSSTVERGGQQTTKQSSFRSQSASRVSSIGSQDMNTQPAPSSVNHTSSASSLSEHSNSTAAPTTMISSSTTQAQIPSPSPSLHCNSFTVYDKDCKKACSNAGGTVEATQLCSPYSMGSTIIFNVTKVKCDVYCPAESGAEAVRNLLLTVVVGIQLIMLFKNLA